MFSQPESAKISDTYTAVRILGGNDLDDAGRAFMERYGVGGYPTLLALTPDGDLLTMDLPRSVDGILAGMEGAAKKNEEFLAQEKDLQGKKDVESWKTLADLYEERRNLAAATTLYEKILKKKPSVETHAKLAELAGAAGDKAKERSLLETMVKKYAKDEKQIDWKIRLATMDLPSQANSRDEMMALIEQHAGALEKLRAELEGHKDVAGEAAVRARIGNLEAQRGNVEAAKGHAAWILEHDAEGKQVVPAHMVLANLAYREKDVKGALEHLRKVVEIAPDSQEAGFAKRVIPQLESQLPAEEPPADEPPEKPAEPEDGE